VKNFGTVEYWFALIKVAAIIGFHAGLRTPKAAKIALELVIDVQDVNGDRIVMQGDDNGDKTFGRPGDVLTPPAGGPAM